jgi:alpha-amylase/alpha-mannosidase (GH57 family)
VERFVCIHGHFYQPPRDNPWLERIERQESARPFRDWNERIEAECYRPNARARILDESDSIVTLVNNYARMSFNFGPTLLSWMEAHAPRTYAAILEADKASIRRFGRGSAIAQAHGHLIMPLCSERDRRTQVSWGIRDFIRRFGRQPEGMWLPETAACTASLRALADAGLSFTILAPRQAKAVRAKGAASFVDVTEDTLDTRRPYRVDLGGGKSIAVFFYDGGLARAVAFEHLLASGDSFAARLLGAFRKDAKTTELVHIATDGETYGHHHRFGEMALAYALDRIEASGAVKVTNYAAYLAAHPPQDEAVIVERSSWSCAHGVARWNADCGCRTRADSNQAWRAPLREALDKLRDRIDAIYERAGAEALTEPWAAREDYVDVGLDRTGAARDAFLARYARGTSPDVRRRALQLAEMQRHRMAMFTSCGWFFDDVSGLETTQILQYASRAVELAETVSGEALEHDFLADLDHARATTPGAPSGRAVYEAAVRPARVDLERMASTLALTTLFGQKIHPAPMFEIDEHEVRSAKRDDVRFAVGRITVAARATGQSRSFAFAVLHEGGSTVRGGLREIAGVKDDEDEAEALVHAFEDDTAEAMAGALAARFPRRFDSLRILPLDDRATVVERIVADAVQGAEAVLRQIFAENAPLLTELAATGVRPPAALTAATRVILEADLARAARKDPPDTRLIRSLVAEARAENVRFDEPAFSFQLGRAIARTCAALEHHPADDGMLGRLSDMIDVARKLSPAFDLSLAVDLAWSVVREDHSAVARAVRERGRLGAWKEIARALRIKVEE